MRGKPLVHGLPVRQTVPVPVEPCPEQLVSIKTEIDHLTVTGILDEGFRLLIQNRIVFFQARLYPDAVGFSEGSFRGQREFETSGIQERDLLAARIYAERGVQPE